MDLLDGAEFAACVEDYDRAVASDTEIDAFCSRGAWVSSFHEAFRAHAELRITRDGGSFVALAAVDEPRVGLVLEALESMWGFASPLVGPESAELLGRSLEASAARGERLPLLLSGVPVAGARLEAVIRVLARRFALRPLSIRVRFQASLEGGADGWLARRSAKFRRNLRAARRRTRAAGVVFESMSPGDAPTALALYERVLAIERRSWKAATGNGVDRGPMREFYARMLPRLAVRGDLRVLIAQRDGADLGYLYGGTSGALFRGLQFSFTDEARALGLGHALQAEMIERLCAEGALLYDLGSESAYKRHWAEPGLTTTGLLARPRD